jgi:hypothetical protein
VVLVGAVVSTVAVLTVLVALPVARRWTDREAEIRMRAEQLARLDALIASREPIERQLAALQGARAEAAQRLLGGETMAVAASDLQLLLNRYAAESKVTLDRVDVVNRAEAPDSIAPVPARIVVRGDIYGLVDLLFYLQHGQKLLVIDDLRASSVQTGRPGEANVTATVSLHGYYRGSRGQP